jgi:NADPH:quinone reductase-like Zn-dependent oxidoreductase
MSNLRELATEPGPTMTALRAHTRGGPEKLDVETVPRPARRPGDVLVAVHAAGITFDELGWDLSWQTRDGQDRTPVIPSHEFSGIVVAAPEGEVTTPIGSAVFGMAPFDRDGAAAEYVAVPVDHVSAKPRSLSHVAAAALPLAASTAWQALTRHAEVRPGERVLVHGGAGGVGAFAVQIALSMAADVTATVRGNQVNFVEQLGAHRVIEIDREPFDADGSRYDVIIDTVGGDTLRRSFAVTQPGGRIVTLQAPPDPILAHKPDVRATFFVVNADRPTLEAVAHLADSGRLDPQIARAFPLEQGRVAYGRPRVTAGHPPGKTVLIVTEPESAIPTANAAHAPITDGGPRDGAEGPTTGLDMQRPGRAT